MTRNKIHALPLRLTGALVAVFFLAGFEGDGCIIDPGDPPPDVRIVPVTECYADADCADGERCVFDDQGDDDSPEPWVGDDDIYEPCVALPGRCEPVADETCETDADCGPGGYCEIGASCMATDCPPAPPSRCVYPDPDACRTDADCAPGGYCEHYDTCMGTDCPPAPPSQCVYPHTNCDDGSEILCDMLPPECEAGMVLAAQNGCWACVDPATCEDPCWGSWIDQTGTCRAPNDGVYPPECCPAPPPPPPSCTSDADCPNGYCEQYATCAGLDCPPPPPAQCIFPRCDDGSDVMCEVEPVPCPEGQTLAVRDGCWACVDARTCQAPGCAGLDEVSCLVTDGCTALYTPVPGQTDRCGPQFDFVRCE